MPTIFQLESWVKSEIAKGKGHLHTNHVVCIEDERAKQIENKPDEQGRQKTKFVWDLEDHNSYSIAHLEKERYIKVAKGNVVLAGEAWLMAVKSQTDDTIRLFLEAITSLKEKP